MRFIGQFVLAQEKIMSDAYVIEIQGHTVGIIVKEHINNSTYKFLSALNGFSSLDGREFAGPFQAEIAAKKLWRDKPNAIPRQLHRIP
jgi:hypothetical protein